MKSKINVSAIILAAGLSSRMGELKALLDIGEKKAILHLIDESIKAGIDDIVVVLGYKNEEISSWINDKKIRCVVNENYVRGMFSSIQKGVQEIDAHSKGFMIMPVDIPLIKANTIQELATFFIESRHDIISPFFNNIKGHPPVLSRKCIESILEVEPAEGLNSIIDSKDWLTCRYDTLDEGILYEMDTKSQYFKLLDYYNKAYVPNEKECREIVKRCNVPSNTILHMKAVANTACTIGQLLIDYGSEVDLDLLYAAAALHDIKRSEKDHPLKAHNFLDQLGYREVSDIILEHMELKDTSRKRISEKEILYLSDKIVKGNQVVGLKFRFKEVLENSNSEVREKAEARYDNALQIMNNIEKIIGKSLQNIMLLEEKSG